MYSHVSVAFDLIDALERLGTEIGSATHTTTIATVAPARGAFTLTAGLPTINGSYTAYRYAVVEVTTEGAPAYRMRALIAGVAGGTSVVLQTRFPQKRDIRVGDTVTITSGPLGNASVYFSEPDSIADEIAAGKHHFVTVTPIGGALESRGGGDAAARRQNAQRTANDYTYLVTAESFLVTQQTTDGTYASNTTSAARALLDNPTLMLQCAYIIHDFRFDERNGIQGQDAIEWADKIYQRPGGHIMKAAEIKFSTLVR